MFKEKKEKLNLEVSNSSNQVKIKVNCSPGTLLTVSFLDSKNKIQDAVCGKETVIGTAAELTGKTVYFNGVADNLIGDKRITHKIYEAGGNSIEYTFPDDYTGTPTYNNETGRINYQFNCNFK